VLIVSVQYKESDSMVPGARQRADFRKLAELGADVVLGTQAHVPQSFEFYPVARGGEAFIFYGLGNLYFDQTFFYMRSFMPELFIYQGQLKAVDLNVTIIDDLGRPRPMDDHNRIHFMSNMFVR
jgi:poly-gamma-glutamate capsule biosynthesis protein CapA/YwtB (metallophosphatase superfamily)